MDTLSETISDHALVRSALNGDRDAFSEIVRRYHRPLAEFAAARTADYQDAEDAVQETFLRAYQHLESFNNRYSLKNWLFTIAYRQLISAYRKKKTRRLNEQMTSQLAAVQKSSESNDWVWDVARTMEINAFTVLWLHYKQDTPVAEIAAVINKSHIATRVLLHRARKRLGRQIIEHPPESVEQMNRNFRKMACAERTRS